MAPFILLIITTINTTLKGGVFVCLRINLSFFEKTVVFVGFMNCSYLFCLGCHLIQ